jgi:uncharacterized protein (TIGR02001 family)
MRTSFIGLSALALVTAVAAAAPAFADEAAAAPAFTITGSAALTSDYRFRGISQSDRRVAAQASATLTHSSGFYASFWTSSISEYVYAGANDELDLIGGYSKTIDGVTLDGGLLYYVYANANNGVPSDFFEPYASVKTTFGPATAKFGVNYAPKQHAVARPATYGLGGKDDNLYIYGELSGAIPKTPFSVLAHLGYNKGASYLTGGLDHYYDWNLGASYTYKNATLSVTYVDTSKNAKRGAFLLGSAGGQVRNQATAGVVGALTFAF